MGAPIIGAVIVGGVVAIGVCVVAALVGIFIYDHSATPCECAIPPITDHNCTDIPYSMKVPLVATHIIPFILMPVSMWVCQAGAVALQKMGMKSPEQVVLGLAYIMVSIGGEVGWHTHQRWFYQEQFDVLNFFFYVFITLGASSWALGSAQTKATKYSSVLDALLMLCTPLTVLTYALGAWTSLPSLKVPIYIIMSYEYGLLSWRLFKLLNDDFRVWLFPFFSVGMNLLFVYFLSKCTDPHKKENLVLNPIFHILHDAVGTEMGVLVITLIIWSATSGDNNSKKSS